MWYPNLDDVKIKKGKESLLKKAVKILKKKYNITPLFELTDNYGTYAYIYPHLPFRDGFVLVAKRYIYGYIVSVHSKAVEHAIENDKILVMYIDTPQKRFYSFEPQEIIDNAEINYRGNVKMLNFNIRLGKNWVKNSNILYMPFGVL